MLVSNVCNQAQLESDQFRRWVPRIGTEFSLHRKLWEFCYIAQALDERDMLRPGRRGLGFGVGREPLVELFAGCGCEVVATDQPEEDARRGGWIGTDQHAARVDALYLRHLCDAQDFRRRVAFRFVDMNRIPADLRDFDFTWSSCCFEHLGSIGHGLRFILKQMECLRPGGVAVHTTEFNVSSNRETVDHNANLVLFRRRDLEGLARRLSARGHEIELDFTLGDGIADRFVDLPPYRHDPHLRLQCSQFVTTSIGLIVRKRGAGPSASLFGKIRDRLRSRGA